MTLCIGALLAVTRVTVQTTARARHLLQIAADAIVPTVGGIKAMKTRILGALLCALAAGSAVAETLVVDDQVTLRDSTVERPKRGSTMTDVEKHFGAPVEKH